MANKVSFIIQLKDKFGPIAAKIDQQFRNIERSAAAANKRLDGFEKRGENLRKLGGKMAKTGAIMSAGITVPVALIGRALTEAASDATETANKFNSVFDDVQAKANQVANNFSKDFGTAGSTARKLIGDTGDLLVGFGFSGDAALDLSRKVNELAADLTSFQNVEGGVPRASEALTKALLGETEMAKSLGIVIRQNDPVFKQNIKNIMRSQGATEMQAKAIAILNIAQQQSSKAIGDVSRTWDDYASVVRRNDEATKQLKETYGKLLIPIMTKVKLALTAVANWLSNLSPGMQKLILLTGGIIAVVGPLLVLVGTLTVAFSGLGVAVTAATWPVLLIVGAIVAVGAAIAAVAIYWDDIVSGLGSAWDYVVDKIMTAVKKMKAGFSGMLSFVKVILTEIANFFIGVINAMLAPISFLSEFVGGGAVQIPKVGSAPVGGTKNTLEGSITVSAEPGTKVSRGRMKNSGAGLNIGMNVPAGAR